MPPTLPPELILWICSELHPSNASHRRTLAALARSSRTLHDLALPILYRDLTFDDHALLNLLACGRLISRHDPQYAAFMAEEPDFKEACVGEDWGHLPAPSERWRTSLAMAQSVTIRGPLHAKTLQLLWSVCQPDTPLFPSASKLCVRDSNAAPYPPPVLWHAWPRAGVLLFNALDYCTAGYDSPARDLPGRLPVASYRHVVFHTGVPDTPALPGTWESCTVYETDPLEKLQRLRHDSVTRERGSLETAAKRLRGLGEYASYREEGPDIGGVPGLLRRGKVKYRIQDRMPERDDDEDSEEYKQVLRGLYQEVVEGWREIAELVQEDENLEIVVGDEGLTPCCVCGKTW